MTVTIRVRSSRAKVAAALRALPAACSGRAATGGTAARTLLVRLGLQALTSVSEGFAVRSRGGTDDSGLAWPKLKRLTIKLKKPRAERPREAILRDDDLLRDSLTPGTPPEAASAEPPPVELQVFRLGKGSVEVGTRRKHAMAHHTGVPPRLPQRRLWPERWPARWLGGLLKQARLGVVEVLKESLGAP